MRGCLIALAVLFVLAVIAGFVLYKYGPRWAAEFMGEGENQMIDRSDLPAQEKAEIKVEIARLVDAFRDGRMSWRQAGELIEKITESPLLAMMIASAADQQYIGKSGLSDEEKAAGRLDLRRFVRGVIDEKIPEASVDAVMAHIADRQSDGEWKLRQQVSDEQLRAFLSTAKAEADKANIPLELEAVDPSDEFKRVVDEMLKGE